MKYDFKKHGFELKRVTEISEICATLYETEHIKSGARLLYLDREDENKTFSVAFKTIPEDNTGVFHIIEHSVLCGSDKYPVKEPFVELLKGSLNTFLNAMTFPDKTMYPFSSRNDKDFSNLMSIYLDAVFHPAILTNENIFRQEGWHYVLNNKEEEMTYSGVVLNEMRGAYSSPETLAAYGMNKMLYKDTPYRFESGGEPTQIQDLTYGAFVAAHKKYYHPSNSEIFLDGSVKLDEILSDINKVLSDFDRIDVSFDIPDQPVFAPQKREIEYEITPNEAPENKTRMSLGFVNCRFDEQEKNVASAILSDAILSSNESPLKKVLIGSGLCEDVNVCPLDSIKENGIIIDFTNVKDGQHESLSKLFFDTVEELSCRGIDKELLTASLNSLEFKMREKDYGRFPTGLVYAMAVLESSLYGGHPAQNLSYEKTFSSLREKISAGYFEKLLSEMFITNERRATLIMSPSSTLGERRAAAEKERLAKAKAAMTDAELDEIIKMNEALTRWQQTPDTKEALDTLPMLKISDISAEVEKIPESVESLGEATLLTHDIATNGITYLDLYFNANDLDKEEVFLLRLMVSLFENVKTEEHTAIELQNLIKSELGSFDASMLVLTRDKKPEIFVNVSASALDLKKPKMAEIIKEILYTSVYTDKEAVRNVLRQMKLASDEAFTTAGHATGLNRAGSYINAECAIKEYYSGYEAHKSIKALDKSFDEEFKTLAERIKALSNKLFTKKRLTVSVTGAPDKNFANTVLSSINDGPAYEKTSKISPLGARREGIVIPAQASYATLASNLYMLGEEPGGSFNVARSLISYGYLWGKIRVQGGAYGAGLVVQNSGNIGFYSYRDPSPQRSLDCYCQTSDFLREFAESGEDITKFIIGAVGDASPLNTPKLKGSLAAARYLRGKTYEDECRVRREMLDTDKTELIRIAGILDRACKTEAVCVVAGKDKLDTCQSLDEILEI